MQEALKIGQEIGSLRDIERASYAISESYKAIGDYKKAYNFFYLYKLTSESINNEESVRKFTQLEMQHEFDKKQKEQEYIQEQKELQHRAEIKRRNIIVISLSLGVFLLFIFAVFIYRNYQQKKRDNELLRKQKDEIKNQHDQISKQKKSITDSIHYARRIQSARLPPDTIID